MPIWQHHQLRQKCFIIFVPDDHVVARGKNLQKRIGKFVVVDDERDVLVAGVERDHRVVVGQGKYQVVLNLNFAQKNPLKLA